MGVESDSGMSLENQNTHFATKKAVPTHEMLSEPSRAVPITGAAVDTDVWSMKETMRAIPIPT